MFFYSLPVKILIYFRSFFGGSGGAPQAAGGKGVWVRSPQRWEIFLQIFNRNKAFLCIFRLK